MLGSDHDGAVATDQLFKLLQSGPLILYSAVACRGTRSLWEVLCCVTTRCASMHRESSDDDVLAMVQKALPVEKKEYCVLCEQQFDDLASPRSKYTIFAIKHWKFTLALDHVPRKRSSAVQGDSPMVDKQKHNRSSMQREMVDSMLESTTSSLTVKRTRGVLLLTKAENIKHQMNTKHSMTAEKATQMWKTDLDNPDVHGDV